VPSSFGSIHTFRTNTAIISTTRSCKIGVDLGLIGLVLFAMVFIILMARIVVGLCNARPAAKHMFAISIFIFLLLRLPIEVDLLFQFQIASILICMAWIYLRRFGLPRSGSDMSV